MSYEDIKKVQKKYAWFIDNNQLALVEKLNIGGLSIKQLYQVHLKLAL